MPLAAYLPEEVYEALYYVAHGDSVQEALAEIKRNQPEPVITNDLDEALQHPDTLRRVAIPQSADALAEMLDTPLADWRVFLHPDQRGLVIRHFNGPARVLGGAGTGKTVVALHRAAHLARTVFDGSDDRLLFTTYTRNLAANIKSNLTHLCPDVVERIDVYNLHRWAFNFLKQHGRTPKIVAGDALRAIWQQAIREAGDGSQYDDFYQAEWENVMVANGITTQQAYLRIRRRGQLDPLNRKQRLAVWRVFDRYLDLMDDRISPPQLSYAALQFIEQHQPQLPYRAIVVDEVQDLFPIDLKLLRAIVPEGANDLFLVGDAHQRIYSSQPVVMSHVGIQIRGRSRRLRINYRTTEQIRNYAVNVLEGIAIDDMDGGADSQTDHRSLRVGLPPTIRQFQSTLVSANWGLEKKRLTVHNCSKQNDQIGDENDNRFRENDTSN